MHRSYSSPFQSLSLLAPAEDSLIDGLPGPAASTPLHLKISSQPSEHEEGMPSTSQSWPPTDYSTRFASFAAAGQQLGPGPVLDSPQPSPEPAESAADSPWSPAAAFLSAFTPSSSYIAPDASGQTIAGYVLGPTIGHGGFSTIKEATSPSGGIVAIKIVRHSAFVNLSAAERARQRSRLSHEARIWVALSHENILPLFDSHRTAEATYLITLYCPAGSLFDILKREGRPALEQTDAGGMFRQVVKGLQYLHECVGLVHGDVKLENVLVDESGVCRLADFGLARSIGGDSSQVSGAEDDDDDESDDDESDGAVQQAPPKRSRRTGTNALPVHLSLIRHGPQRHRNSAPLPAAATPPTHPDHMFQPGSLPYAAPELLLPHSHSQTGEVHGSRPTAHPAQDMWALGVLLYTLLTGGLPFRDAFEPRLQMKILRGTYDMPPAIGPLAESVLKGCLERDVSERWTISTVDNAAWGIGYGNVELSPVLREEQRSQSQSRSHSGSPRDLVANMSSCSVASTTPVTPRGRPPRVVFRSQSRSPSPSVAPRTPDDEDEDAMFFGRRRRRRRRGVQEESDVQIVGEGDGVAWDARDRVFDEEGEGDEPEPAASLGADKKCAEGPGGTRGRRDAEQSRARSWTLDELAGPR